MYSKSSLFIVFLAEKSPDEGDYDFPDSDLPPTVPRHKKGSSEIPPSISTHGKKKSTTDIPPQPSPHKKKHSNTALSHSPLTTSHSQNNLASSSSDEDDDLDYNDPETFFAKPPAVLTLRKDEGSRMASLRRGSNMQPFEYIPASEMQPMMEDDDDDMYCDPESAISSKRPTLNGENSDIYSDGKNCNSTLESLKIMICIRRLIGLFFGALQYRMTLFAKLIFAMSLNLPEMSFISTVCETEMTSLLLACIFFIK